MYFKVAKDDLTNWEWQAHPTVQALVQNYDVLQGISNTLLVNEQVKEALEKAGFNGVTINPFKDYEIRLASQSNGNQ